MRSCTASPSNLAIRGSPPPNLVPRPSLLPVVPWQLCCLQSQSSPVPSQTRRSAAPASTVDNLHLNLHALHLGNPTTPPRLLPPLLPTAAHPLSHFTTGFKTALLCSCCRVARPALPLVPTCYIGPGNCKSHTLGCCTALLLIPPRLQSTWSQRPSATRRPFDSRRALIIRPSLFGLDPALPTRIPYSLDIIHGDHSLLAPPTSASRLCRRSFATASHRHPRRIDATRNTPDRPPLVSVLVTAPAARRRKKVGPGPSIACSHCHILSCTSQRMPV